VQVSRGQYWINVNGTWYRVDFAWPELRLILECDGRRYHDFESDRERWSALAGDGWRIIYATWRDVCRSPEAFVERVQTALNRS
jgi:very-short-patch-repair endonuclease